MKKKNTNVHIEIISLWTKRARVLYGLYYTLFIIFIIYKYFLIVLNTHSFINVVPILYYIRNDKPAYVDEEAYKYNKSTENTKMSYTNVCVYSNFLFLFFRSFPFLSYRRHIIFFSVWIFFIKIYTIL